MLKMAWQVKEKILVGQIVFEMWSKERPKKEYICNDVKSLLQFTALKKSINPMSFLGLQCFALIFLPDGCT